MTQYILRRILYMIPTLFIVSIIAFLVIQLPPGDYLDSLISASSETLTQEQIDGLTTRYGLDEPIYTQYVKWVGSIIARGDFGQSFQWNQPVGDLIWERLGLTLVVSLMTLVFVYVVSLPIGIYSAVKQYSLGDYIATVLGFLGLAIPNFLFALALMYIGFKFFGQSVGGLFSPEFIDAPWTWARFIDMLGHLWVPVIILGTAGTAQLIRVMRANLLDELAKPYVEAARARGMSEVKLIVKYPVRIALNALVSAMAWIFPMVVSGSAITSIVLNLQTTGPLLYNALKAQDMYLAGSLVLLVSVLTVIGTLVSDILLAWLDPRIQLR